MPSSTGMVSNVYILPVIYLTHPAVVYLRPLSVPPVRAGALYHSERELQKHVTPQHGERRALLGLGPTPSPASVF